MEGLVKTDFSQRRVLVTGATGIVGSWLTRRLVDDGAYVVALIRDDDPRSELYRSGTAARISIVTGPLEDYATIERAINEHETDVVFHLGAQTIVGTALRAPLATFEANIRGSYNLLEACRRLSSIVKAVVVASSDKAYGDSEQLPYVETMPPLGRHPYDVSKSCTDLLAMAYAHTYETPVAVARCGNIYGGGDLNWSRIVPGTIRAAIRNEQPQLRSDGTLIRDYIFVDDVVDAYLALGAAVLAGREHGEAFNFSTGLRLTVMQILQATLAAAGSKLEPVFTNTARAEILNQYLDSSKAEARLGWTAKHGLDESLRTTVAWYRDFFREHA